MEDFIFWLKNVSPAKYYIVGSTSIIVVLILFLMNTVKSSEGPPEEDLSDFFYETSEVVETTLVEDSNQMPEESSEVVIELKGQIASPGVYSLEKGARLADAISAAGGVTESADDRTINRALILVDQMMIYIPEIGEEGSNDFQTDIKEFNQTEKININTAEQSTLTELNGIGDSRAQSIVLYREETGRFKTIEEIKNISGIGEKIFESIKEDIVVD